MGIYAIKDNHKDSRCKYGEIECFITCDSNLPKKMDLKKYLDSEISYNNTYYFSSEELANKFEDKLYKKYHKENEKVEFKTYSELMQFIDNEGFDKTEEILDYDNFAVVKIGKQYFYYEKGENDCDEFYEVEVIANIDYDINHDIRTKGEELGNLFDNFCCGEYIYDEGISYLYFDIKGE